jgi:hypothetical protein
MFRTFHRTTANGSEDATYSVVHPSTDNGAQERPSGFSIYWMGNCVRERYFAKDFDVVPGHRSALSVIVSCLIFRIQVVANDSE